MHVMLCLKPNLSCQMLNNFDCREATLKHLKLLAVGHLERSETLHFVYGCICVELLMNLIVK